MRIGCLTQCVVRKFAAYFSFVLRNLPREMGPLEAKLYGFGFFFMIFLPRNLRSQTKLLVFLLLARSLKLNVGFDIALVSDLWQLASLFLQFQKLKQLLWDLIIFPFLCFYDPVREFRSVSMSFFECVTNQNFDLEFSVLPLSMVSFRVDYYSLNLKFQLSVAEEPKIQFRMIGDELYL